ncbi:hypothetical protein ABFX02_01G009800 [Erythranthe guttata]
MQAQPDTKMSGASFGFHGSSSAGGHYSGQYTNFDVSDFFDFDQDFSSLINPAGNYNDNPNHDLEYCYTTNEVGLIDSTRVSSSSSSPEAMTINNRETKKETRDKVAFRTKSEVEILDDGFKWRKYGKKMVKNSPNPRNYYKCSVEGCVVKKRVERDKEDQRYVLTTYEGIHNHQAAGSTLRSSINH